MYLVKLILFMKMYIFTKNLLRLVKTINETYAAVQCEVNTYSKKTNWRMLFSIIIPCTCPNIHKKYTYFARHYGGVLFHREYISG